MFISSVLLLATLTLAVPHNKRATAFFNPNSNGGSMLDDGGYKLFLICGAHFNLNAATGGFGAPGDLGEPLNVRVRFFYRQFSYKFFPPGHHLRVKLPCCPHGRWIPQLCSGNRIVRINSHLIWRLPQTSIALPSVLGFIWVRVFALAQKIL